ncbi:NAD(P)/FAD-dependent oxidoreductase [Phytomonospora endophytica]|uniref:NADH dehydrogenase FAD-containing subunit n=1 Tax=Phytomonospora endophytica TaxID=714109 RepID=A0A841FDA3_9ACTN|nr:FAD-dependent oxidoreductase [Phytomonospora endophytica]MBB6033794.1 NADH dehydrogenase FAD-containing subunit [Phytomonospora endophytica]GIG64688.1 dehydrogenase [Phytomonospora endophytica]
MNATVAVIGGGYGGSALAKALDDHAEVTLVDPKDAFVHSAGALRALVDPTWAHNMFFPYDTLLTRGTLIRDRAASVDPQGVTLASGTRLDADYIVLASGSRYPYPAKMDTDDHHEALGRLRHTHGELAEAARVLIVGAGPVGLELAGEISAAWADKTVTLLDPAETLLPAFAPQLRRDLHRQLDELGVRLRLGTSLTQQPPGQPGQAKTFTVATTSGPITADIWFRAYGVDVNGDYLGDGRLTARNARSQVHVTEHLTVDGHPTVYAIGDITDLAEAKMAGYAMQHAEVAAANILAQINGKTPQATYRPAATPSVLLPLGPKASVGQFPGDDGPLILDAATVSAYKGTDLFTGRFHDLFGTN